MTECPLCGEEASKVITIEMGDRWHDTLGKPPYSLFNKYKMIHSADSPDGKRHLFLHAERDLAARPPGSGP